jgi:hypothetical protein
MRKTDEPVLFRKALLGILSIKEKQPDMFAFQIPEMVRN